MALKPEIAGVLRDLNDQIGDDLEAAFADVVFPPDISIVPYSLPEDGRPGAGRPRDDQPVIEPDEPIGPRWSIIRPILPAITGRRVLVPAAMAIALAAVTMMLGTTVSGGPETSDPAPDLAMVEDDAQPTQRVVVGGDTVYLEGLVPDQAVSDILESAAIAAIGPDRVVNNFRISGRAIYDPDQPLRISAAEPVLFTSGAAALDDRYRPLIDLAADLLRAEPLSTLAIIGHTDDVGPEDGNLRLSIARAESVARLVAERGVDRARLTVAGRGEEEPIDTNETAAGRAVNRRVEFAILGVFQR